jgi:hypothetical protein
VERRKREGFRAEGFEGVESAKSDLERRETRSGNIYLLTSSLFNVYFRICIIFIVGIL